MFTSKKKEKDSAFEEESQFYYLEYQEQFHKVT